MRKFEHLLYILFIFCIQCNKNKTSSFKEYNIQGIHLYQIDCGDKIYFSLEKGSCHNIPKDYFSPKGDSESYYCLFLRNKNNNLEVYSPYNNILKMGKIENQLKIVEYKEYKDNVFIEDSIKRKSYVIDGTEN
jgi:hypothetical protein